MSVEHPVVHRWFPAGDLRFHGLGFGSGPPSMVLLHGVGSHAWSWSPFVAACGPEVSSLAIDLRGHGDSQWSPTADYATTSHARDAEAILDAIGSADVTLVGASWGGLVGLVLAVRRPDLVARLVMIDLGPSSTKDQDDVPPRPTSFESHEAVVAFESARNPRADPSTWDLLAAHGTRPADGGLLVPKHDPLFARRWGFRTEDHWAALAALTRPLLVVKATDSPVLPDAVAERMVAEARDARLERIAGTGHVVHLDDPSALAATIRTFIDG